MPSCELETGRHDSRVSRVQEMAISKNVLGTTPANKEVIYSISSNYDNVVAIDADGGCVEVIDQNQLEKRAHGRFDRLYTKALDIRSISGSDYLLVNGIDFFVLMKKGWKKKKKSGLV